MSSAYNPFPPLLEWLQAVATRGFPEEFDIDKVNINLMDLSFEALSSHR